MRCMPAFLVRLIDTHDSVGIYSVETILQLIVIIDECNDPGGCEYRRLRFPGGVMWEGPAVPVPVDRPEDADGSEPDPIPWGAASVTERWFNVIYGYEECRWKRFYSEDPRPPTEPVLPQRHGPGRVVPFKRRQT